MEEQKRQLPTSKGSHGVLSVNTHNLRKLADGYGSAGDSKSDIIKFNNMLTQRPPLPSMSGMETPIPELMQNKYQ